MTTTYAPGLFASIAAEVATIRREQYIYAKRGAGRPTLLYSSPGIEEALLKASERLNDPVKLLEHEYCASVTQDSQVFNDGAVGKIDVQGFIVEVAVMEISPNEWRVLFTRANAEPLGRSWEERFTNLLLLTEETRAILKLRQ